MTHQTRNYDRPHHDPRIIPFSDLHSNIVDISGQQFGRLTALGAVKRPPGVRSGTYWLFSCSCGGERITTKANVTYTYYQGDTPSTRSCGCLEKERLAKARINLKPSRRKPKERSHTRFLEVNGEVKPAAEWAKLYHIPLTIIYARLRAGVEGEAALTPVRASKKGVTVPASR